MFYVDIPSSEGARGIVDPFDVSAGAASIPPGGARFRTRDLDDPEAGVDWNAEHDLNEKDGLDKQRMMREAQIDADLSALAAIS